MQMLLDDLCGLKFTSPIIQEDASALDPIRECFQEMITQSPTFRRTNGLKINYSSGVLRLVAVIRRTNAHLASTAELITHRGVVVAVMRTTNNVKNW